MASGPKQEPSVTSVGNRSGRGLRAKLQARADRSKRAWARVENLEERGRRLSPLDSKRAKEAIEARDLESLNRELERHERARQEREAATVEGLNARRRAMLHFELPNALVGLVSLAALAAANSLWLAALGVDYFGWYLQSGFLIALVFGVVVVAIDLDSHLELIAAEPILYIAGIFQLFSELYGALWGLFARPRPERALAEAGLSMMQYRYRLRTLDLALTFLFVLTFLVAMHAWALLVAPLQYWVNLVCGAPAREALASSGTLWVVRSPHWIELLFAPKDPNDFEKRQLKEAHERGEMTEVGFTKKPVAFTAAIAAAFLFGISQFV